MNKFKFLALFLALVFGASAVNAADLFSRNLTVGSRGADVKNLQKLLNQYPETKLASFGPGSPGNETDFFGPVTKSGVVKFQNKFKSEVLTPLNIASGTGFFGPSSRAKANSLSLGGITVNTSANSTNSQGLSLSEQVQNIFANYNSNQNVSVTFGGNGATITRESFVQQIQNELNNFDNPNEDYSRVPKVSSVNPEVTTPGEYVNVYGSGFTSTTKAYLDRDLAQLSFVSSGHVRVRMPSDSETVGPRVVRISNIFGDTMLNSPQVVLILNNEASNDSDYVEEMSDEVRSYNTRSKNLARADVPEKERSLFASLFIDAAEKVKGFISPEKAYAFGTTTYGGPITQTDVCTCLYNLGTTLSVSDKASNQTVDLGYSFIMGSRLRANYNIFTSQVNVIGGYVGSFSCMDTQSWYPYTCDSGDQQDGLIDMMIGIGTGQSPA